MEQAGGSTHGSETDRLALAGASGVVGRCRDFVHASLAARGWLDDPDEERRAVVEDVMLMTSELVTNACLHAGGPREVSVRDAGRSRLRVEVVDASPQRPTLRTLEAPAHPGGHGLRVVDRLASRWGSEPRPEGKAVWFEIERPTV
ncbi:ATP-binding protein [Streptacidiphilus pinicola]|uniref:ATP-binding protein n=1 Tax=Streptacidiphilus pinicola TaxID=2219663 RepID=A0A2X0IQF0_9ACTN|nr:ATP-binding protein [Streptacidiphilus pinicola]RAG86867.1 ATP-binding protein [Streptacidiphilus pinicola]